MSKADELLKLKELLDAGVITQEEFDRQKSSILQNKSPKKQKKNYGMAVAVAVVIIICLAVATGSSGKRNETKEISDDQIVTENVDGEAKDTIENQSKIPPEFEGECPVSASAVIGKSIIGFPELTCKIRNNTDKEIAAVLLYFEPKDVYGEEADGIFAVNKLRMDESIGANSSKSCVWQLIDDTVKSGDAYIYSVYFSDGTEWGNRNAVSSDAKKYGLKIEAQQ